MPESTVETEPRGILAVINRLKEKEKADSIDIKKMLDEKKGRDKITFVLEKLKEAKSEKEKAEILPFVSNAIEGGASATFHLGYDSFSEGLEPAYFWVLDFLKNNLFFKVDKTKEDFEASVGSAFFSDIGMKTSRMQEQAINMLGRINTVMRSIINLIYDLKEFEIRIADYDKYHSKNKDEHMNGLIALKQVWMDQVDMKKGAGSINNLAQRLEFVTLRDAYLSAENVKDVKKMDLNERVKRILIVKVGEFYEWLEKSEIELKKRYKIERGYLKSQASALKMYAEWTKPYLIAAQKLGMKAFNSPNVISTFNNMELELELLATKEIKTDSLIDSGDFPISARTSEKVFACVLVTFNFRSVPHSVNTAQGTQYRQGGRVDMFFRSLSLTENELKLLKSGKEEEAFALIDDMVDTSLLALSDDILKYINEEDKDDTTKKKTSSKEKPEKYVGPFGALLKGWDTPFSKLRKGWKSKSNVAYFNKLLLMKAAEKANGACFTVYDIYKKAHGMLSV